MNNLALYNASQLTIGACIAINGLLSLNTEPGGSYSYLMVGSGILLGVFSIFHFITTDDDEFEANPLLIIVLILAAALVFLSVVFNYFSI